jgi:hypothetical protein
MLPPTAVCKNVGKKEQGMGVGRPTEDITNTIRYNEGSVYSSTLNMKEAYFSKLQGITFQKTVIFILPLKVSQPNYLCSSRFHHIDSNHIDCIYIYLRVLFQNPLPSWTASVVKWSEFLTTDPEVRVRFQALPDFLRSSGSGMGSTQPHEYN